MYDLGQAGAVKRILRKPDPLLLLDAFAAVPRMRKGSPSGRVLERVGDEMA
jgi:hypothetical protein